jgi:soluble lytic murein transglycosylase-like protein
LNIFSDLQTFGTVLALYFPALFSLKIRLQGDFMKTLFMILLLTTTNLFAKELSFMPSAKKNYVKAVMKKIPSYEVEMKKQVMRYIPVAQNIAHDLHVSADLVISVIWIESHFKSDAKSKVGAKGLMQIMPKTRKALINEMPDYNIIVSKYLSTGLQYKELEDIILGTYYLNKLKKRFNGNTELAIVAYNMGPTWVSKRIANNLMVGTKNHYLNKVKNKMTVVASAE